MRLMDHPTTSTVMMTIECMMPTPRAYVGQPPRHDDYRTSA
jgi:hypothetical protein